MSGPPARGVILPEYRVARRPDKAFFNNAFRIKVPARICIYERSRCTRAQREVKRGVCGDLKVRGRASRSIAPARSRSLKKVWRRFSRAGRQAENRGPILRSIDKNDPIARLHALASFRHHHGRLARVESRAFDRKAVKDKKEKETKSNAAVPTSENEEIAASTTNGSNFTHKTAGFAVIKTPGRTRYVIRQTFAVTRFRAGRSPTAGLS
ncbi:hypothetical protein EVAR_88090_1 [Eumeta japonica]|uniref:Uncharacterized protein n=1 Tax=Eumeta variegata TaxID=151549 RepID=A0A4C1WJF0_EUMVA|nr:hypothetical protein EVAR_88090_1 [Eumeta japonica]